MHMCFAVAILHGVVHDQSTKTSVCAGEKLSLRPLVPEFMIALIRQSILISSDDINYLHFRRGIWIGRNRPVGQAPASRADYLRCADFPSVISDSPRFRWERGFPFRCLLSYELSHTNTTSYCSRSYAGTGDLNFGGLGADLGHSLTLIDGACYRGRNLSQYFGHRR